MAKARFVFVVLMLAGLDVAFGQALPNPLPENDPHARATADSQYPSAQLCGKCHPNQYKQWSVSSHAYANVSPMFNKFEQRLNDLASGTVNYFCVRCHASVGTALAERREIAWWNRQGAAQEGITCVTCHRNAELYKILVSSDEADRTDYLRIHQQAIQSDILTKSQFCAPCHQVAVHAGIKLETVWEEWRASPAAKKGIQCQDCHMSKFPGQPAQKVGWDRGWAATVNGQFVNEERKLSDHTFVGPGYPISHPGLFPIAESPFTPQQWLTFDYRAGWGSDEFENTKAASTTFPPEWQNAADRKKAWARVQENYAAWRDRRDQRLKLMENASRLDGPYFTSPLAVGQRLTFEYKLTNLNEGHNLPSGSLGAQPELWLPPPRPDPPRQRARGR